MSFQDQLKNIYITNLSLVVPLIIVVEGLTFTKFRTVYIITDKIVQKGIISKTFELYLLEEEEEIKKLPSYKQKLYCLKFDDIIYRYILIFYEEEEVSICYDYVTALNVQSLPPVPPILTETLVKTHLYQPTRRETRKEIEHRLIIEQQREEYERQIKNKKPILQRQTNNYQYYEHLAYCIDCNFPINKNNFEKCEECYEKTIINMSVHDKITHINLYNLSRQYTTTRWTNYDTCKRNSLSRTDWLRQLIDKKDVEAGRYIYNNPGCCMLYRGGARLLS